MKALLRSIQSVAYHDIHRENFREVHQHLECLRNQGVSSCDLMVIPGHERNPESTREFSQWLYEMHKAGHRLWCHGWQHKADLTMPRSFAGRLALRLTGNEAELAGLSRSHVRYVLERAWTFWQHQGFPPPLGFVAPTWHAPRTLIPEAFRTGFQKVETRFFIHQRKDSTFSFPLSFFSGTRKQFLRNLHLANLGLRIYPSQCRLVLHPADFQWQEDLEKVLF